ncbi:MULTISPECIES: Hsp20/alpha crystallin family protein [unclassified Nostoc]|uniref:Hsp20/alpha crystallin family protein n=1 Tax=unclassified Nostoc TaxID=2593658 RepID=UPI0025AAC168|nr:MULTISPECIES: Hsp20/alpha crystallin family protein [unclassified Nostoc]MDM9583516.1 Hsp20/alpha crystallin family protein [Nostoc sp. GT001]MDZ7949172.1 Hsp20/alpha crystallin family protein [Nostoc sp. EfeVER01]MDZ7994639.1 Hsp20/alpha crystallin family protein [Nostoc sp. EspVER01]
MPITHWQPFQEIERWEPLREMEHLQQRMNRLLERMLPSGNGGVSALPFIPSAEMEETSEALHLKLEIPGLESKDLNVEVTEESVLISGERKSESKTEEKGMVRSEFHYGKFERVIPLPAHVQQDKAQAEYKNGILTLTLPKIEGEKKKAIKINLG